jgi:hypothetical protein
MKCLFLRSLNALIPILATSFALSARASDLSDFYQSRYPLADLNQKLLNNHGEGFDALYGARNFRAVIPGKVYRGGANNKFHKSNPRPNMNPLPPDGLANLCQEGFETSVYLYRDNYDPDTAINNCRSIHEKNHTMSYVQLKPTVTVEQYEILKIAYNAIRDPNSGPIYLHCWNGWHFSGLISALVLRQFCGMSGNDAVDYWDLNTDGWNDEPQFEKIRKRIRDFQPYKEFQLDKKLKKEICF